MSTFYFINNSIKSQVICIIFCTHDPEEISVSDMLHVHHSWKVLPLYFVKGRSYASDQISIASLKNWMHFK